MFRMRSVPLFVLTALMLPLVAASPASAAVPAALDAYAVEDVASAVPPGPEVRDLISLKGSGDEVRLKLLTSRFGDVDPEVSAFVQVAGEAGQREIPMTLTKRKTGWFRGGDVLTLRLDGSELGAEEYLLAVKVANVTNGTRTTAMVPFKVTDRGQVRYFFPEEYLSFASTGYYRHLKPYHNGHRGEAGGDIYPGSATPYVGDGRK